MLSSMVMPKGSKHSDETKRRIAEESRARWADPEYRERMRQKHRERVAAKGTGQQKKAAAAAAEKLRGTKKTDEQKRRSVEGRRAKNGGRYFPEGSSASINMVPEAADDSPKEYTGDHPNLSAAMRKVNAEGRGASRGHTEETRRKISETKKRQWAEGVYANKKPATRRRVSRMELSLVPYLEKLGYEHVNEQNKFFIYHPEKGMVPDFVDRKGKRVFEFFGDFWHPEEDEAETVRRYAESGWACTVLWERDLEEWKKQHDHLL